MATESRLARIVLPILLAAALPVAAWAQPKLSPDNIDEILKALTLEEKAALLVGTSSDNLIPGLAGGTRPVPRLGIPQTVFSDGPAGVRIDPERDPSHTVATGFPVGTLLASSWDTDLVESMTLAMGEEAHEYGVDVLLAPGMNIHRNPLCGRNFEYFSEDPVLSGKIAAAYVRGIQSQGVGTSVKHFAANNQETNRTENDALVSRRALREIYLKNFEIVVKEGRPWTVMSSYNKLNGRYTQQDHDLLTGILRDEWGYDGIVITDWGLKEGTVAALKAGGDLMDPGAQVEVDRILEGVKNGLISMEELDQAVRRILEYVVKTPHFKGYKYSSKPDLATHAAVGRKAAEGSIVLLKNQARTLPMSGDERIALFGNGALNFVAGGTGSGDVTKAYVVNMVQALSEAGFHLDPRLSDYYRLYRQSEKVAMMMEPEQDDYFRGPEVPPTATAIDKLAVDNDVAIVVIGRNAGEGRDRREEDFELSEGERILLSNVSRSFHSRGKKVVTILNIGGVIETASWKGLVDAIVLPWSPGQDGARAVADVLTGKVNPSGKLPMTFPSSYMDIPSSHDFPFDYDERTQPTRSKDVQWTQYTEDIWVGYRYFQTNDVEVSYPFGHGLSYTTFAYSKPVVKNARDGFTAGVTITNTGSVPGREVVELYVSAPAGGLAKPFRELKAFAKTRLLAPGESQTLAMDVSNYDLASFNEEVSAWQSAAGTYKVLFGASVCDIRAEVDYTLKKALEWKVADLFDNYNAPFFAPVDAVPAGPGLKYTYCEGNVMSTAQVAAAPIKTSGIAPVIGTMYAERDDHYGFVFMGLVKIDASGLYRIDLSSDDGAKLWLDGKPLLDLDHDGGGAQECFIRLGAGYHRIEVVFFENYLEERLMVGLHGPGVSAGNIPATMLFHE